MTALYYPYILGNLHKKGGLGVCQYSCLAVRGRVMFGFMMLGLFKTAGPLWRVAAVGRLMFFGALFSKMVIMSRTIVILIVLLIASAFFSFTLCPFLLLWPFANRGLCPNGDGPLSVDARKSLHENKCHTSWESCSFRMILSRSSTPCRCLSRELMQLVFVSICSRKLNVYCRCRLPKRC